MTCLPNERSKGRSGLSGPINSSLIETHVTRELLAYLVLFYRNDHATGEREN